MPAPRVQYWSCFKFDVELHFSCVFQWAWEWSTAIVEGIDLINFCVIMHAQYTRELLLMLI